MLEFTTLPDVFTLGLIDNSVIENIEVARFKDIVKISSVGVLQIDDDWRTLYASRTWSEMTGYSLTAIAGREWTQKVHKDDQVVFFETLHQHAEAEKNSEQDVRIVTATGEIRWFNVHYRINYDLSNDCNSIILIFLDVHNQRKSQEELRKIATTDKLTNLGNRYAFQEELEKYIRQLHSTQAFNLLFLDLDGFKSVNDAYGHLIGDKLLSETARRISLVAGKESFVARLGGDEFAILRPETEPFEVDQFAANLLKEISKPYSLLENSRESYISSSIGIVSVKPGDFSYVDTLNDRRVTEKSTQLLREADAAMFHAKDAGKNTYRFYAGSINEEVIKKQRLNDSLHRALMREEFSLQYQPQWNVKTNELYGYEALLRWQQGSENIGPDMFIPLMESNGLMSRAGKWVFERALRDHSDLLKKHAFKPRLSVNFSPIQFRDHTLCDFIEHAINKYNLPANTVTIEITESLLISDYSQVNEQLERLKNMGLKIALDDFGTGYSSLSSLHNFPIDIIKVDQNFTRNLQLFDTQQIVRSIIKMSNVLNKVVLFEGIETEQQLEFLKNEGVEIIQGWLISKALPLEALETFMREQEELCLS